MSRLQEHLAAAVDGGARCSFTAPFAGPAVVYLTVPR